MTTVSDDRPAELEHELGLRERKKQHTRHAIHEAAFRLIEEQGLDATTIDQICAAAEVSSRTFFNYFPSKAAALLQLPEEAITPEARERFRVAEGGLVWALCDVVGSAEFTPDRARIKSLIVRHPELITTISALMLELRSQYVALATERAVDESHAELAVALVMAAMGRSMHDQPSDSDTPLVARLRHTIEQFGSIVDEQLR